MGKELDGEHMHETTMSKFNGLSVHEDGDGSVDDAAGDHDHGGQDAASRNSDDAILLLGQRAVQVLGIRVNFPVSTINGYDWRMGCCCIYVPCEGEVQKEGTVDLVPTGPGSPFMAYGYFSLEVFPSITRARDTTNNHEEVSIVGPPMTYEWSVCDCDYDKEPKEYTETICGIFGRMFEVTFLVIPSAIEANVEVRLKLKDLDSRSRAVYGKIKATCTDYGNKSVHLFCCKRGRSCSVPSSSSSILPLSPSVFALPCHRQVEFQLEVDLKVITISGNQEEEKNLKFRLKFTYEVRSQEREVDGDQVEVNIAYNRIS
ncbi:unnamed protein product [Urochloa humidicola]